MVAGADKRARIVVTSWRVMFTLDEIRPRGRSFDEYCRMFKLGESELGTRILGCGDGPASFNAEATCAGVSVVSCDPLYRHDARSIRRRIDETSEEILEQLRRNEDDFVWEAISSPEELATLRHSAMRTFLEDFDTGLAEGRYVDGELPYLPFADGAFDLALCSHLLFLYSAQLDTAFHVAAVAELCRVATDVRIYPLLALGGQSSPHVSPVLDYARDRGFEAVLEDVPYEFQRGARQMMRVCVQ